MTRRKFQGAKRIDSSSEYHDAALEGLVKKLRSWLVQQPEWIGVLSADRDTRKRFARVIGREATRIPAMVRVSKPGPTSRLAKADPEIWTPVQQEGEDG